MSPDANKLYTIQPDYHYGIFIGQTHNSTQMLATYGIGDVFVQMYFNAAGEMLHIAESPEAEVEIPPPISSSERDISGDPDLLFALSKIGLVKPQPIQVRKFFIANHLIGIRQYPDSLQRFLAGGHEYTTEEIEALKALRGNNPDRHFLVFSEKYLMGYSEQEEVQDRNWFEEWTERGDFVLWCQNDFWCNSDGYIHSS